MARSATESFAIDNKTLIEASLHFSPVLLRLLNGGLFQCLFLKLSVVLCVCILDQPLYQIFLLAFRVQPAFIESRTQVIGRHGYLRHL